MIPSLPVNHVIDTSNRDAVTGGEVLLRNDPRCVERANLNDLISGESGVVIRFPKDMAKTSLADGISYVVALRPEEEMIRSDTAAVIALVANKESVWNWANIQQIGDAMRHLRPAVETEVAIGPRIRTALPLPAVARFVDLRPKTFKDGRQDRWAVLQANNGRVRGIRKSGESHDQNRHLSGSLGWQEQRILLVILQDAEMDVTQKKKPLP